MKQEERTSIMRIVSDLIKADAIIDTREIKFLMSIKEKYGIKRDDERYVSNMTLSQAIRILVQAPENLKRDFLNDCMNIALSDDYCARTEALIIVSLLATMTDKLNVDADVVSVEHNGLTFENAQMLYVESSEDELANKSIRENYREIISESRLAGFDFFTLLIIGVIPRTFHNNEKPVTPPQ